MSGWAQILGLPAAASEHAGRVDGLIGLVHIFMLVLFVGWGAFFIYSLIRFRRSNNPKATYSSKKGHLTSYLEGAVVAIEIGLLVGLSIPFWATNIAQVPDGDDNVTIRVVAQQFAWNIHYPGADGVFGPTDPSLIDAEANPLGIDRKNVFGEDDIWTINQLHIPVDRLVVIELASYDVVHSFSLPMMRVKQDAIPGMTIPVAFTATQTGQSEIACAQLCGLGHFRMRGFLTVHPPQEFDAWLSAEDEILRSRQQSPTSIFD